MLETSEEKRWEATGKGFLVGYSKNIIDYFRIINKLRIINSLFMKKVLLFFTLLVSISSFAQVVNQSWASVGTFPYGIAIDASGNVYTSNNGSYSVSKIDPSGTVVATIPVGSGPRGLAVDASNNVYVTNYTAGTVSKINPNTNSVVSTITVGAGPEDIAIDVSNNVYVTNYTDGTVSKIDPNTTTVVNTFTVGASPSGIAADAAGNVYIANYGSNTVSKISAGGTVTTSWATVGAGPKGITVDAAGNVYTANYISNTVSKITASGSVTSLGTVGLSPWGITVDASGNIYTANYLSNTVSKITPNGSVTTLWVSLSSGAGSVFIAIDAASNLYVTNNNHASVSKIMPNNRWIGTTNTDWSTPTNWSYGSIPSSSDNVIIPTTSNTVITTSAVANNIIIQNRATLTLNGSGTITASNGITVNPGGALVGDPSNVTGTVTLQQSIVGQRGYRIFANPFSTSQTNLSSSGLNATTTTANDIKTWSNASNAWQSAGSGYSSVNIAANTPYACFIRGSATDNVTGLNYTTGPSAFTYSVSGTLNTLTSGNYTVAAPSNSSNISIVGNPFAAPVKISALTNGTSVPYYVYSISATGTPRVKSGSWTAQLTSDPTTTLPVLGVIAWAQPASSYTVNTSSISTANLLSNNLFGTTSSIANLELQLEQSGVYQDKLFIRQDATATANGTDKIDLPKFSNDVTNIYTITPDQKQMAIDARSELGSTIPLGVSSIAGDYNFRVNSNTLPTGTTVYLQDNLLHTQTALETGTTYNFSITADAATQGEQRFALLFASKNAVAAITDSSNAKFTAKVLGDVVHGNTVTIEIAGSTSPINIVARDINGKILSTATGVNGTNTVQLGNAASGICIVQISNASSTITEKIIKL